MLELDNQHKLKMKELEINYEKEIYKQKSSYEEQIQILNLCKSIDDIIKLSQAGLIFYEKKNDNNKYGNCPQFQNQIYNNPQQMCYPQQNFSPNIQYSHH